MLLSLTGRCQRSSDRWGQWPLRPIPYSERARQSVKPPRKLWGFDSLPAHHCPLSRHRNRPEPTSTVAACDRDRRSSLRPRALIAAPSRAAISRSARWTDILPAVTMLRQVRCLRLDRHRRLGGAARDAGRDGRAGAGAVDFWASLTRSWRIAMEVAALALALPRLRLEQRERVDRDHRLLPVGQGAGGG